jgi:hypothetical protein
MLGGALTSSLVRALCGGRTLHVARGELSTVSDERNNIHWFKATSDHAFMFNVAVFGLDGTKNFSGRDYIDPLGAERLGDGTLRARRITDKEAFKLYGNT